MTNDYADVLEVAVRAARKAGVILHNEFSRPSGPRGSGGHADADAEAELVIRRDLLEARPRWGYLGEETGRKEAKRAEEHVWLVDPNDGTRGFIKGSRGSAISIAVLRDGVPVLGVVFAFAAPDPDGDLFAWAEGCGPITRNGAPVEGHLRRKRSDRLSGVALLSEGAENRPLENALLVLPARFRAMPSIAYRLALAAADAGVVAVSLSSPGDWDYAGGHALVAASGGKFVDESGRAVWYDKAGQSRVGNCFGGDAKLAATLASRDWSSVWKTSRRRRERFDLVRLEPGRNVGDAALLRRAQGCLLGLLAGDALGSLVEFESRREIAARYPDGPRVMEDGGTWNTIAGQPTDDGEMALMLARSIVEAEGYADETAAQAYAAWYRSRPFDIGSTVGHAVGSIGESDLREGRAADAARAAASRDSQANGSLMRVAPIGIWGHDLPAAVVAEAARQDASLTHPHPVCRESAAVFVVAVAHAVRHGGSPRDVYEHAVDWAASECREKPVVDALRRARREPPAHAPHAGWVLVALQNAFYHLVHSSSLEETVVETVAAGGDTDTNAAIAGALAGAVHGRDAVPSGWRDAVLTCHPIEGLPGVMRPRPPMLWPVDALELAERLLLAGHPR